MAPSEPHVAFLSHDGRWLRCGACSQRVGFLRWDRADWPHPEVAGRRCSGCGRRLILSPERLEADTIERYQVG
jgi:hypothetical protein